MITVRRANPKDLPFVTSLLTSENLPILGVQEHLETFFVAEDADEVVGVIGLEAYGETGLLRSAIVERTRRGLGIGEKLYQRLIEFARTAGVKRLVLLTNTAEGYFRRKGFTTIPQSSVRGSVTSSVEFSGACPSHAVCMELVLRG